MNIFYFWGLFFKNYYSFVPIKYLTDRKRNLLFMETVNSGFYNNTCIWIFFIFETKVDTNKLILICHRYSLCAWMCNHSLYEEGPD